MSAPPVMGLSRLYQVPPRPVERLEPLAELSAADQEAGASALDDALRARGASTPASTTMVTRLFRSPRGEWQLRYRYLKIRARDFGAAFATGDAYTGAASMPSAALLEMERAICVEWGGLGEVLELLLGPDSPEPEVERVERLLASWRAEYARAEAQGREQLAREEAERAERARVAKELRHDEWRRLPPLDQVVLLLDLARANGEDLGSAIARLAGEVRSSFARREPTRLAPPARRWW